MRRVFVISSGTSIAVRRETVRSASAALELVRHHMRLRRPGVIIETAEGERLTFFQLKGMAEAEARNENGHRP